MRLLYARIGRTFCRQCGQEVVRETAEIVAKRLNDLPAGTRVMIGFQIPVVSIPPVAAKEATADIDAVDDLFEGEEPLNVANPESRIPNPGIEETLNTLQRRGYGRLLVDGRAVAFDEIDRASLKDRTTLDVIVDRLRIEGDLRSRLTDSIETSYREGGGAAFAVVVRDQGLGTRDQGLGTRDSAAPSPQPPVPSPYRIEFSERFECRNCGITYETPQPRLFSFNNPFGACPTCHGFGNIIELDMDLVVPDTSKSINQGAIEPWSKPHYRAQLAELKRAARKAKLRLDVPWSELTEDEVRFVVEGSAAAPPGSESKGDDYEGIRGFFRWLERKKYKVHVRVFLSRYRGYLTCPDCGGARLRREARDVQVAGRTIDRVSALTVREAQR